MSLRRLKARSIGRFELLQWLNKFLEMDYARVCNTIHNKASTYPDNDVVLYYRLKTWPMGLLTFKFWMHCTQAKSPYIV